MYVDKFIQTYCKIEATKKGVIPFELYEYQLAALQTYNKGKPTIVLKSRQLGMTTLAAAYALWKIYSPGENVLFLSKKEEDANDILRKLKIMYENLPEWLKIPITMNNMTTIEFANKNRIQSLPATDRSGAGKTSSLIIIDEFSAFPGSKDRTAGEDVWNAILPTMSTGGQVIVQSTPKGLGNMFYKIWAGDYGFERFVCHWTNHPVFGENKYIIDTKLGWGKYGSPWADKMKMSIGKSGWAQEFDCNFLQSGRPVFDINLLTQASVDKSDLTYTSTFACGVDLASGSSDDFSVAQFINIDTGTQVECYRSQEPIDIFAQVVLEKCKKYNNCQLAFENNSGYGISFMKEIKQYNNIYYQRDHSPRNEKRTKKPGWNTNVKTKQIMINDLNIALTNKMINLTDTKTIDELKTFVYFEDDTMGAMNGLNDDTVMSLAIAWQVAKTLKGYNTNNDWMKDFHKILKPTIAPTATSAGLIPVEGILFSVKKKKDWRLA